MLELVDAWKGGAKVQGGHAGAFCTCTGSLNASMAYRPVIVSSRYLDLTGLQGLFAWTVDPQMSGFNI